MGFCILTNNIDTSLVEDLDQSVKALNKSKQNVLVSGENIKKINGQDLTGSGDISIDVGVTMVNKTSPTNGNITLKTINSESLVGNSDIRVVKTAGDTMTGNLNINRTSGDTGMFAERTDKGVKIFCGVGDGGSNHGVYSYLPNNTHRWLLYGNTSGDIYVGSLNFKDAQTGRKSLQVNINEVCTSTDTNPSSTIGGTWTKVRTIRETKIARVYTNSNLKLLTYNGNTLSIDLPPDFHQSLGCKINYWPNLGGNWNNGAIVSLIRDNTFSATTSSKKSSVVLTTINEQYYTVDVYLEYLSDDAIYVWKRS